MTCYRIKTPDDVAQTLERSGLEFRDWPENASSDGFAAYLLVYGGGEELDTRGLVGKVHRYLETTANARAGEALMQDAQDIAETINDYNGNIRELGMAVQKVRRIYGSLVFDRLALLAVQGDGYREYLEEMVDGLDLSSPVDAALRLIAEAAERFEAFGPNLYRPYECDIVDHVIFMRIVDFDENLADECPWDGSEEYMVPEVVALVRLGQNREVRALATEIAMQRRIGAAQAPAVVTSPRSKAL